MNRWPLLILFCTLREKSSALVYATSAAACVTDRKTINATKHYFRKVNGKITLSAVLQKKQLSIVKM